ncbi:hypothetical protein ABFS82_07G026700 [Erythranthe guttata]
MDDDDLRNRVSSLLRVMQVTRLVKDDSIPSQIEEGLYLGSLGAAYNRSGLKGLNITHVLTVAHSLAPAHPDDFIYKTIEVRDKEDENISQYFEECFQFIYEAKAAGGGILVHCFAGRSRSATVVVAYLMLKNGMSFSEAMEYVKIKRAAASPNSGFILQLHEYESALRDAETKKKRALELDK